MSISVNFFQACIICINIWLTLQLYAPQYPYNGFPYHGSPAGHKAKNPLCDFKSSEDCATGSAYVDRRQNMIRHLKGGGTPVLVDHSKRCSNGFIGIKQHPQQPQYYYVCNKDNIVFAKCGNLEIFNITSLSCQPYNFLSYFQPVCTHEGRYPIENYGSYYYRCDLNLEPRVFSCPSSETFSPFLRTCIPNIVNVPTFIAENDVSLPKNCEDQFPACQKNGTFSSPHDCSFYYTCVMKNNNIVFLQTRYKCPEGSCFDLTTNACECQKKETTTGKPRNTTTIATTTTEKTSLFTTASLQTEETTESIATELTKESETTTTDLPTTESFGTTPQIVTTITTEITPTDFFTSDKYTTTEFPTSTIFDSTTDSFTISTPTDSSSTFSTTFEDTTSTMETTTATSTTTIINATCIPGKH